MKHYLNLNLFNDRRKLQGMNCVPPLSFSWFLLLFMRLGRSDVEPRSTHFYSNTKQNNQSKEKDLYFELQTLNRGKQERIKISVSKSSEVT